jgi:hypothetical protein
MSVPTVKAWLGTSVFRNQDLGLGGRLSWPSAQALDSALS